MADDVDKPSVSAEKAYADAATAAPVKAEPAKPAVEQKAAKPAPTEPPPTATKKAGPAQKPTITELKDKIMATAKSTDFSKTATDTVVEFQRRAKEAYDKGAELSAETTEFAKENVEAMVEAGKILAAGVQDLGKTYADEAKSAYETVTADLKELASIKSPTELFQLQSKLLRRNFDMFVAFSSKNTEAVVKLASESFAPISGRVSLAAEKLAKVA